MSRYLAILRHEKQLEHQKNLFANQLGALIALGLTAAMVGVIELIWPNFFNYPYFTWSVELKNIVAFWPLFCCAGGLALLSSLRAVSSRLDEDLLG